MGRGGKQKMEMISNKKSRLLTLKTRKDGLFKKLHQLTTLCDVPACMIIYDPTTDSTSTWPPQDSDATVRRLIDGYKAKRDDPTGVRRSGLSDFFNERRRRHAEDEKDCFSSMDASQLRDFAAALRRKAEAVRSRIEFLKLEEMVMKDDDMMMYPDSAGFDVDQDFDFGFGVSWLDVMTMLRSDSPTPMMPVPAPDWCGWDDVYGYDDLSGFPMTTVSAPELCGRDDVYGFDDLSDSPMMTVSELCGRDDVYGDDDLSYSPMSAPELCGRDDVYGDDDLAPYLSHFSSLEH